MTYTREPMAVVKARLGGFQDEVMCECQACRVYEVDEPPVFVPDGWDLHEGRMVPFGRWLHGRELLQHLAAIREFLAFRAKRGSAVVAEVA
jgi:hypothetical protein